MQFCHLIFFSKLTNIEYCTFDIRHQINFKILQSSQKYNSHSFSLIHIKPNTVRSGEKWRVISTARSSITHVSKKLVTF